MTKPQEKSEFKSKAKTETKSKHKNNGLTVDDYVNLFATWIRDDATEEGVDALVNLGYMFEHGKGMVKNIPAAMAVYAIVANTFNNDTAGGNLGYLYTQADNPDHDFETGVRILTTAANNGNALAMVNLGNIYEGGYDGFISDKSVVKPNANTAKQYYLKAALMGQPKGAFNYANMLFKEGKQLDLAFDIFRSLMIGFEDLAAAYMVAQYYEEGYGSIEKDLKIAINLYEVAADHGDALSMNQLGRLYSLGQGVRKNVKKGFEWYMRAGDNGDALGYANVGYCYETGQGVKKDLVKAREFYQKAVDMGSSEAQGALDNMDSPDYDNPD